MDIPFSFFDPRKMIKGSLDDIFIELEALIKSKNYIDAFLILRLLPSFMSEKNEMLERINEYLTSADKQNIEKFDKLMEKAEQLFQSEDFEESLKFY